MPTQAQIENAAGIDAKTATFIMKQETARAKSAMSLLKMCVDCFEQGAFALLKEAVKDCKKEME
jgi:hypothetical protein